MESSNSVLYWKETEKEDAGDQCTLGKPYNVTLDDLWDLCKADGLDWGSDVM